MTPLEIAALAFNFLKPFLRHSAEEFSKESGKSLWASVKSLFTKHEKQDIINKIEKEPANEEHFEEAQAEMAPLLYKEPATKAAIEQQLKTITESGIYQQVTGDYNIVLGKIENSKVEINQNSAADPKTK